MTLRRDMEGTMMDRTDLAAAVADIHARLVRLRELDRRELELLGLIAEALRALRRDIGTLERLVS
jgi:hypothetical protein